MIRNRYLITALAASLLASCSFDRAPLVSPPPAAPLPAPAREVATRKTTEQQLAELQQMVAALVITPTLGKSDVLNISVYDEPDLSIEGIPVRPDGMISFPLVGDVQAEGRTVGELSQTLSERLRQYLLTPRVSIIVQEFGSLQYTVYGEVTRPGVYPLLVDTTIADAIAKAGGLSKGSFRASSVELADLSNAFIARQGKVLPVDFVQLLRYGDLRFNVKLQAGDYISIPSGLSKEVYIIGEVVSPALLGFNEEMSLSGTVALAEGFTHDADLSRIHVVRGALSNPTLITVDFKKVIAGQAQDIPLQPGDIVYIPPTTLSSWARMLDKIVPTIQAIQTGVILRESIRRDNNQ
jgi:polysaccharide export outer membrane protein